MDQKLTKAIQDWLNAMPEDQNIAKGATMLLQCNRNRVLYNNIIRNPEKLKEKLIYELRKHLAYRLDGLTLQQVKAMDTKVTAEVVKTIKKADKAAATPTKGQRPDHDQLPADIQQLFFDAHDMMVTMRSIHEKLKLMNADKPCERYTHLKELIAIHDRYRACYNKYDSYVIGDSQSNNNDDQTAEPAGDEPSAAGGPSADVADAAKAYGTYRGYLLANIEKLQELDAAGKTSKADRLRDKMQARYDECKKVGMQFTEETLRQLGELGIE